jgi:hypothetical protein
MPNNKPLAEHERIVQERIAAIAIERDRLQQDSIEQAKAINRLAAAAEDRNIVDKNKEEFFLERIATAVKAARVQALEEAAYLHESVNPASDAERHHNDPGAGAMGAVIEYRDAIRALITTENQGDKDE